MPASGQPFWIDVYGSELAGLRVKAAAALAARAALDGHRVLLTERGGGQLRRGLPAALRPGDGFELFHPRGMPRDLLAVAVAAEWDEERERAFAEFAAAFDAVVCCREQPAEHNGGAAVVAGAWDGEAAEAAAKLCERIPGAAFVAATAARRPGSHPATVAAAREKHPAFAAGRDLPLYAHEPLRPPGSDEVGGELWTGVAELLAELGLPAKRERSDAAPDADMIAASRPLGDADARVKFETAQLEMNDAGAILAAELDADERFAERVEAGGAAMAEERAAAAQRRTGAGAARAEALAAAAAARAEVRRRRTAADEQRRAEAAAANEEQWRALEATAAARRAEAAARLRADLDATLLRHRQRSEEEAAAIEAQRLAEEEERRAAEEARAAAQRAKEEEAQRLEEEKLAAARAKKAEERAARRAEREARRAEEEERQRAAEAAEAARQAEEARRAAAEKARNDALIKRKRATAYVPVVDRAKLRELLAPQDLDELIEEVNTKGHAGVGRPDRRVKGDARARFAKFRDFYAHNLSGHMRERGADFVCANIALVIAAEAAAEEDYALEALLREFAMDIFCTASRQSRSFSLRHWFLNTVWLAERYLYEGDLKRIAYTGGQLAQTLFKARAGLDEEHHLLIMRAVLGLLLNKVETKLSGAEDPDAHEYERMLLADLDQETIDAVFLDKEEAAAAQAEIHSEAEEAAAAAAAAAAVAAQTEEQAVDAVEAAAPAAAEAVAATEVPAEEQAAAAVEAEVQTEEQAVDAVEAAAPAAAEAVAETEAPAEEQAAAAEEEPAVDAAAAARIDDQARGAREAFGAMADDGKKGGGS